MSHVFSIEEIHNNSERGVSKLLLLLPLLHPATAETNLIPWTRNFADPCFAAKTTLPSLFYL
jgi:hypothetical protein